MIRKLRIKLILASMLSLFAVLFFILSISIAINYRQIVSEADETLSTLEKNNGAFPKEPFERFPELPFESRYFSVQVNSDGNLIAADTQRIAAVDEASAIEYAREVLETNNTGGFSGSYRYSVQTTADGKRITFLDCSRNLYRLRNFLISSVSIAFLGMAAVLVLIVYFSKRIIRPVAESYEKQRRFITDAGHEIKTPLAIICADADVLEMDTGENEWLADIKAQTRKLTDLTNDLICLSRMEEMQSQPQMADLSLSELAQKSIQSFQSMAIAQEKAFSSQIAPSLLVCGDEKALARLLSILLDNALKYCPAHGSIEFKLERHGKQLFLELTNTAEDVRASDLPHLFDRFYRADASRNSSTGGYGIGLSIASAVVTAHRGKISASTKDGNSLTMTVLLPSA